MQLALTAASPLWRGYIADVDCRWNVIAGSVDDRTEEERGIKVRAVLPILSASYPVARLELTSDGLRAVTVLALEREQVQNTKVAV